jgi:glycosidase
MITKNLTAFIFFIFTGFAFSQVVTTEPEFLTQTDSIVIFLDTTQPGAEELLNYNGTIYAHTGVTTNLGSWQHVIGDWGNNQNQPALTSLGNHLYKFTVGFPRQFYSVTNSSEQILEIAAVFRSADASLQTRPDIFITMYEPGLNVVINNPSVSVDYGDPLRSPAFLQQDSSLNISVSAIQIGTQLSNLSLFIDGSMVSQTTNDTLNFLVNYSEYSPGALNVDAIGVDTAGIVDTSAFILFLNPNRINLAPPAGTEPGINYNSSTSITLMLQAPYKNFVYVLGDFNDWEVGTQYFLNRYETGEQEVYWWITLNGITPGTEYAFQYLVDGEIRVGDPFSEKILDPWNDQDIPSQTYPNLKPYPAGKTDYPVTVFQTNETPYQWQHAEFQKPQEEKLMIYELLIRDFMYENHRNFQSVMDSLTYLKNLGVNAIELMPVMEFEGNNSWGYNPMFHGALDKYYGTKDAFKALIDSAHGMGMAIILDIVLNHAFGQCPLVRMYWDNVNNRPATNSPWFNPIPRHPYNVGYDFNHESPATKYYVSRVLKYWLNEFKVDGFRFDLSKGFTQFYSGNDVNLWSQRDTSRINILEAIADTIWTDVPDAYMILEHFAVNSEETDLSNYGMMLWGNMNGQYNEATMGYASDLSGVTHISRGWNDLHLISYMESHDEERLMFKNLQYGNSNGGYDIKQLPIAIQRMKLAGAFYFTIPGPRMIWEFGELGYDYSINWPCMTSDCRLDPKPPRWDYYDDGNRKNLYKVWEALIKLKDYETFSSHDYSYMLNGYLKRITFNDSTMSANIIGNFSVFSSGINPQFPSIGWWYDYFSGDSMYVTNVTQNIPLEPGEFHIYTNVKLPAPEPGILLDAGDENNSTITTYSLEQNYPNPFNPSTKIRFAIPNSGFVKLKVFDILGREIKTLINNELPAGIHEVNFDASYLSSGIYFYRIESGSFVETKKMILLK